VGDFFGYVKEIAHDVGDLGRHAVQTRPQFGQNMSLGMP
jgi:hypothetical protein